MRCYFRGCIRSYSRDYSESISRIKHDSPTGRAKRRRKEDTMKEINGYTVKTFYAGMTGYSIWKDGKEVYFGYSVSEVIKRFGFNPNEC